MKQVKILFFSLFCILAIVISFFHEPWYDEFQAWAIAKDSLYNILFVIPHMEGHPPLWHLIIKLFQQFTSNPELAIKIPNLLIMFSAIWLLIFKSPFPNIIKFSLPFTYFIFYQYSIINRPYCIFILAMFLLAALYKDKNTHPIKFTCSLALLALSSAYGMIISTCIALLWGIEVLHDKKCDFQSFFKDIRFVSLVGLFFLCLLLSFEIIPDKGVVINKCLGSIPVWQKYVYFMFGLPADATAFNIFNPANSYDASLNTVTLFFGSLFGLYLLSSFANMFYKSDVLKLYLATYIPIAATMGFLYIWPHHEGLIFILFIFYFWCYMNENELELVKEFKYVFLFIFIIQIYWNVVASIKEVRAEYSTARGISSYIKENNLENKRIMSPWMDFSYVKNKDGTTDILTYVKSDGKNIKQYTNVNHQWVSVLVCPYFGKNIFYNYNADKPEILYNRNYILSDEENKKIKQQWAEKGKPEIIIGEFLPLHSIWENYFPEYILMKEFKVTGIWKDTSIRYSLEMYKLKER